MKTDDHSFLASLLPLPFSSSSQPTDQPSTPSPTKESKSSSVIVSTVFPFIRKHALSILWVIGFVIVGLLVFLELGHLRGNASLLKETLSIQRAQHAQEMQEVSQSFERQREAQLAVDRKFEERISVLSAQYEEALQGISRARRVRQRQIESNPSTLPGVFESTFGVRPIDRTENGQEK